MATPQVFIQIIETARYEAAIIKIQNGTKGNNPNGYIIYYLHNLFVKGLGYVGSQYWYAAERKKAYQKLGHNFLLNQAFIKYQKGWTIDVYIAHIIHMKINPSFMMKTIIIINMTVIQWSNYSWIY